jgi:hypothetical protein
MGQPVNSYLSASTTTAPYRRNADLTVTATSRNVGDTNPIQIRVTIPNTGTDPAYKLYSYEEIVIQRRINGGTFTDLSDGWNLVTISPGSIINNTATVSDSTVSTAVAGTTYTYRAYIRYNDGYNRVTIPGAMTPSSDVR